MAIRTDDSLTPLQWKFRKAAEADLETFIRLIAPKNVMGSVHQELCGWWTREEASRFQITLLPRDHGKSRYVAYRVAWHITNNPDCRILYVSATSNLAEKQLKFIQDILTSPIYTKYWPEMVHPEIGKREKWTSSEFSVDHPKRKEEGVRDPTVFTGGLTTAITGLHCDVAVLDDVVVYENAYTEEGRTKVKSQFSLLASIEGADAQEWVVGTRYHPKDLYGEMLTMQYEVYDDDGEVTAMEPVYEIFERAVEDQGDGTGEFLWPRQQRSDGRWFGFDRRVLATKRAKYPDKTQYYAQYYNDPNSGDGVGLDRSLFQYYDKELLTQEKGHWYYGKGLGRRRLNVVAAMDFSYSIGNRSDYTALIVLGMDSDRNYYVLDVIRFKTDSIKVYYEQLLQAYIKWDFKKLIAETVSAQQSIVRELKDPYLRPNGIMMSIVEVKPNSQSGRKEERMKAVLDPVYQNRAVWHYRGGNCQVLEDELIMEFPPHDDCKDALSNAIDNITPPGSASMRSSTVSNIIYHKKFGGVVA